MVALLDQVAGSFWEYGHSDEKNDSPSELDSNRDSIRSGVVQVLRGVVNNGGEQQSDCNSPLIATDDCTSDPFRARLGLIERNRCTKQTHTKPSEETPGDKQWDCGRDSLQDNTDTENSRVEDHTHASSQDIGNGCAEQSSEECAGAKNGHNFRCLAGSDVAFSFSVYVSGREGVTPVFHGKNAT